MTEEDKLFYRFVKWERKFCFLPHRCNISKKIIWLAYAFKGSSREPWDKKKPIIKWHRAQDHTLWLLKYQKSSTDIGPVLLSVVKRGISSLLANQLCGVQPMTTSTGAFYQLGTHYKKDENE